MSSRKSASQHRREIMEKVESMVASIETRVREKPQDAGNIRGTEFPSTVLNDFDDTLKVKEIFAHDVNDESSLDEHEFDKIRNVDDSIHVSDVSTSEDDDDQVAYGRRRKVESSQIYSSGSEASLGDGIFASPDEIPEEYRPKEKKGKGIPSSLAYTSLRKSSSKQHTHDYIQPVNVQRSLMDDMNMEKRSIETPQVSGNHQYFKSYQERSLGSKQSEASSDTKSSKLSTVTPFQTFASKPIVSPAFALLSPESRSTSRVPKTEVKRTKPLSPPRVKVVHKSKSETKSRIPSSGKSTIYDMKKEIEDLTTEFAKLQERSRQRRARFHLDAEDRLDDSIETMSKQADAMVDALHRNYARSDQIHRENSILKEKINKIEKKQQLEEKIQMYKSPEKILKQLDPSDDYVKRSFPAVPKTPGTMFATELVENMDLEVGDHAYLAEVMDRQWNTTKYYRP